MLTDKQIRAAKPQAKPFKITDDRGLHLMISPAGGKLWRYRYEIGGKEKLLALGAYPAVSLAEAREARDAARKTLDQGRDPSVEKKLQRAARAATDAHTFESVAREWHALRKPTWRPKHAEIVLNSLVADVFPTLGALPIASITPPMVLSTLRAIEKRGVPDTAHRVRQRMSAVFVHGIASGIAESDPAAIVQKALVPVSKTPQPAVVNLAGLREVLRRSESERAYPVTKLALRLLAITALRNAELRGAAWTEFEGLDGPEPLWRIPAERMKMKKVHLVPLPPQAVAVLDAIRPLTGGNRYVFASTWHADGQLHQNTIGLLIQRAGYAGKHVPHGFRAAFSTILNDRYPADKPIIDMMLAHSPRDAVEAVYNRAEVLQRRRELACIWADLLLDGAVAPSTLLHGKRC